MNTPIAKFITVFVILMIGLSGCTSKTPPPPSTKITVQLKWLHKAQFGGFYAAEQKGYYADEGLAVSFVPGGLNIDVQKSVIEGKAQLGVAGAVELISGRAEGKLVCAIATTYRRNATVFFALTSTGIKRPQDFTGKKIRAVSDQPLVLHAMMTHIGIRPDQYTLVNLPSDLKLFASGDVPVWGAYVTSMVLEAQKAGHQVNIIYPDDYGVHLYGDTIFATDDFIAKNPDLVRRFLRATLRGWTYAVENPTDIGPMVAKYKPDAVISVENAKMTASIPLVNTGEDYMGWMKPQMWAGMEKTLREQKVLTRPVDVTTVYTMQFLEEIYKKGESK